MTHFLWVEDFKYSTTNREENIVSSTVNLVFGSVLDSKDIEQELAEEDANDAQEYLEKQGIILKLNLLEALEFIHTPSELAKIDFVVLDVDMPLRRDKQNDDQDYLPGLIKQYKSEDQLKKIAGYQIYTELVIELGFPKKHILFCSNHAEYFDELKNKFSSANIKPPLSSNPEKPFLTKDDDVDIKKWLDDARCDYFVLRRGIIEGCQHAKQLVNSKLYFNQYSRQNASHKTEDDIFNYLEILEKFLPLREPPNKKDLYKLFIRTLSHEWESANTIRRDKDKKDAVLAWIMRNTRHWMAHNSALFNELDEKMVAYLFIVNIRVMFKSNDENLQGYENILLNLFSKEAISEDDFRIKHKSELIPISAAYLELNNLVLDAKNTGHINDAFYFNELANNIQLSDSPHRKNKRLFTKLLYQMFWLTTSNPYVDKRNRKLLEIRFWNFNYIESPYLFSIARHIYSHSFPQKGEK